MGKPKGSSNKNKSFAREAGLNKKLNRDERRGVKRSLTEGRSSDVEDFSDEDEFDDLTVSEKFYNNTKKWDD